MSAFPPYFRMPRSLSVLAGKLGGKGPKGIDYHFRGLEPLGHVRVENDNVRSFGEPLPILAADTFGK